MAIEAAVDTDDDAARLRAELADWLADNLTDEVVDAGRGGLDEADNLAVLRSWNRLLADAGWAAVSWPAEYGGRGAGVAAQLAYLEEMARVQAPGPVNVIGVSNIAPALMAFGTDAQKDRFLRHMLRGDDIWCQGMSEPDAGSDLASLRTAAVADGDSFVVSGQKTWNSLGRHADWCQLYVRSDPAAPKHRGISCLLVDMRSPGVTVRPIRTMTGDLTFCDIFFDEVRVPADALLGPLHHGWRVAMTTLSYERAGVARLHLSLTRKLERLVDDGSRSGAWADPLRRRQLAAVYGRVACMRWTTRRELDAMAHGGDPSPTMGSVAKLQWARAERELAELSAAVLGFGGLDGYWGYNLTSFPQTSIAGGTSEINRTIVAEHGLGLPREPEAGGRSATVGRSGTDAAAGSEAPPT